MKQLLISSVLLVIACTSAWAHEPSEAKPDPDKFSWGRGAYAGGSLTYTSFDDWSFADSVADDGSYSGASNDDSDAGFRVHAGMNLIRHIDIELGYADYGSATFSVQSDGSGSTWSAGPINESISVTGWDLTLVGRLEVSSDWLLNGRLGLLLWDCDSSLRGDTQASGPIDITDSSESGSLLYGAGVDYDGWRPLRLTLSHTRAEFDAWGSLPSRDDPTLATTALTLSYLFPQPR